MNIDEIFVKINVENIDEVTEKVGRLNELLKEAADLTQNTQDRQRQNEILNEQLELISK